MILVTVVMAHQVAPYCEKEKEAAIEAEKQRSGAFDLRTTDATKAERACRANHPCLQIDKFLNDYGVAFETVGLGDTTKKFKDYQAAKCEKEVKPPNPFGFVEGPPGPYGYSRRRNPYEGRNGFRRLRPYGR